MNQRKTKICARKGCEREFKPYKTTDKYCSLKCKIEAEKGKSKTKASSKKIDPYSKKRAEQSRLYTKKRKTFFENLKDPYCPVAFEVFGEKIKATEIHHKAGRTGKLLNYVPYWMAVSRKGHEYIHDNPELSYERGWMIKRTTVDARLLKKN